jgi:hypothetical protein
VVYAASSIALCCLETLVHVSGDAGLPLQRWLVAIDVPTEQWQQRTRLEPFDLPALGYTPERSGPARLGRSLACLTAVPSGCCAFCGSKAHPCRPLNSSARDSDESAFNQEISGPDPARSWTVRPPQRQAGRKPQVLTFVWLLPTDDPTSATRCCRAVRDLHPRFLGRGQGC